MSDPRLPNLLAACTHLLMALSLPVALYADGLCTQPPENCHAPDPGGGRISTAGIVVCADDFRLARIGCCGGDVNGDGVVNMFDIDPFIEALIRQSFSCEADVNCDGLINNFDIDDFIQVVRNGSCSPCSISPRQVTLSQLCWWGAHLNADTTNDDFRVVYYRNENGFPGQPVCGPYVQSAGQLVIQTRLTGNLIDETYPEREYQASHADCIVTDDLCYWVEISNHAEGVVWLWEFGTGGNGRAIRNGIPTIGDHALCISAVLATDELCAP